MANAEAPAAAGEKLGARLVNALLERLRGATVIEGRRVRVRRTPAGQVVSVALPQEADFRIDGGSNPYSATEMDAIAAGGWDVRPNGRVLTTTVDPLYERTANAGLLPGVIVHAIRDERSGAWLCERASCSATTKAGTTQPKPLPPQPSGPAFDGPGFGGAAPQAVPRFRPDWGGPTPIESRPIGGGAAGLSTSTGGGGGGGPP